MEHLNIFSDVSTNLKAALEGMVTPRLFFLLIMIHLKEVTLVIKDMNAQSEESMKNFGKP